MKISIKINNNEIYQSIEEVGKASKISKTNKVVGRKMKICQVLKNWKILLKSKIKFN